MDNDNAPPVGFIAGKLTKECFATAQEFADELVANIRYPQSTIQIIKGAEGPPGKSIKGDRGAQGEKGEGAVTNIQNIAIAQGSTFVEFNIFPQWQNASYKIVYNGDTSSPIFDPDDDIIRIIGVGTIVKVFNEDDYIRARCYFVFTNCTSAPDGNFTLSITDVR